MFDFYCFLALSLILFLLRFFICKRQFLKRTALIFASVRYGNRMQISCTRVILSTMVAVNLGGHVLPSLSPVLTANHSVSSPGIAFFPEEQAVRTEV